MSGLLGHLATRLARHPENVATEALAYLLGVPAVAEAFEAFLRPAADLPAGLRYDTQLSGADGTRPDLVGTDEASGTTPLLVEAKFWAGLTRNQPGAYLKRLPEDQPSMLLFIVPSKRVETFWPKICAAAEATGRHHGADLRHAAAGHERTIALTSWRTLLDHLAGATGSPDAQADIAQLQGLCDLMDNDRFTPLTVDDLDGIIAQRLGKLTDLVKNASVRAVEDELAAGVSEDTSLGHMTSGDGWWGRSLRLAGVPCWLRISVSGWAKDGATPIWLQIGERKDRAAVPSRYALLTGLGAVRKNDFVDVPVNLPVNVGLDDVVTDMAAQIRTIADRLRTGTGGGAGGR